MRLLDRCPPDPEANIALDAACFHRMEATGGEETLRFWETRRPAVIVGALGVIAREVHEAACLADGVPILRRVSGGGAVLVGPGCLNYALVLSLDARPGLRHVADSYRLILGRIAEALDMPGLEPRGSSDLAIDGLKMSGNAQRRGRRALLHHGTLLHAFDLRRIGRYLKEPPRQPAYRSGRTHAAFVTNVPRDPLVMQAAIARVWGATADAGMVPDGPAGAVLSGSRPERCRS